ncbi:hypothetical protein [Actinophytocola sp.]|uniref:hypothetical protein n=1 Tax=Actinophytocola sp. TaxID=1872138 RepID=UPI002ED8A98D
MAEPDNTNSDVTGPSRGSLVTFLLQDKEGERFRIGEVVGPLEPDPVTGDVWVGVRTSHKALNQSVHLVSTSSIVHVTPPGGRAKGAA